MEYKHGAYVQERATKETAPVLGTAGLQVVVGTAPVNMLADPQAAVNTPLLVQKKPEAIQAVGFVNDFAAYTLCESISVNYDLVGTGPMVFINVLDPSNERHLTEIEETVIDVVDNVAKVTVTGLLLDQLKVQSGEEPQDLIADTDYTASFNDDGTVSIVITKTGEEKVNENKIKVSGKKLDPNKVTPEDIIGTVDAKTGKETGLEVVRQIYPKLGITPGILIAPRFSKNPNVSAALQVKNKGIDGVFSCVTIIDVDSSKTGATKYDAVKDQKEKQALIDPNAYPVWGYGKAGDVVYSGSALAAALTAYTDAVNGDIPNVSPSNKTLAISAVCLEDGTEVLLDQTQANTVNSYGVATFLNMNGFRLWGNNTACYPGNTDPKDRWFSIRRFFCWTGNTFILTYFQRVDDPMNPRLIDAVVDSENVRGHSFVSRGVCARYEIEFNEDENPTTDLLNGKLVFHQYLTPYPPAEDIENILEFDPDALSTLFG